MKKYIHPITANTFIQTKDGSSYIKYWSYLRATLTLEGGFKKNDTPNVRRTIDMIKIADVSNKAYSSVEVVSASMKGANLRFNIETVNGHSQNKQQVNSFWTNLCQHIHNYLRIQGARALLKNEHYEYLHLRNVHKSREFV